MVLLGRGIGRGEAGETYAGVVLEGLGDYGGDEEGALGFGGHCCGCVICMRRGLFPFADSGLSLDLSVVLGWIQTIEGKEIDRVGLRLRCAQGEGGDAVGGLEVDVRRVGVRVRRG